MRTRIKVVELENGDVQYIPQVEQSSPYYLYAFFLNPFSFKLPRKPDLKFYDISKASFPTELSAKNHIDWYLRENKKGIKTTNYIDYP